VGTIAVIGEQTRVQGFGLAGALVHVTENAEAVRAAWDALDDDVAVVILTPAAAHALPDAVASESRLTVVMPAWP